MGMEIVIEEDDFEELSDTESDSNDNDLLESSSSSSG